MNGMGIPMTHRTPYGITMGTLRSTKSVPALAFTRDGCPVHDNDMIRRPSVAMSMMHGPIYSPADRRATQLIGNSVVDLRSGIPGPIAIGYESGAGKSLHQLPLPMYQGRHQLFIPPPPAHHALATGGKIPLEMYGPEPSCCKGHLIVLWIILTVVMLGVISGIVLGVTMH